MVLEVMLSDGDAGDMNLIEKYLAVSSRGGRIVRAGAGLVIGKQADRV